MDKLTKQELILPVKMVATSVHVTVKLWTALKMPVVSYILHSYMHPVKCQFDQLTIELFEVLNDKLKLGENIVAHNDIQYGISAARMTLRHLFQ